MPAAYAHFQFGEECLKIIDGTDYRWIEKHRNIYNYGVQGPDLLFYSFFYKWKKLFKKGSDMHLVPGREIFEKVKETMILRQGKNEELIVYTLGFLSHYVLDSVCHSYIERKKEVSKVSHNFIESQYDAHLMRLNGVDRPSSYPRAYLMEPNKTDAETIAIFHGLSSKAIIKCMKGQRLALGLFSMEESIKRRSFKKLLSNIKPKVHYQDLLCEDEEDARVKDSNVRLDKLRNIGVNIYEDLYKNLKEFLAEGGELSSYFDHCMDRWPNYQELPVLDLEEEKDYIPEGDFYESKIHE